jgi:hypothetical protein
MVLFTVSSTFLHGSCWCSLEHGNNSNKNGNDGITESDSSSGGATISPEISITTQFSSDLEEDSLYDPIQPDPDCNISSDDDDANKKGDASSCWAPPDSTIEQEEQVRPSSSVKGISIIDATCSYGGVNPDDDNVKNVLQPQQQETTTCGLTENKEGKEQQHVTTTTIMVDKHWGSDPTILRMRDKLRESGSGKSSSSSSSSKNKRRHGGGSSKVKNRRPPIFLMPGLASTRLIAWRFKSCPQHPFLSDIKVQENGERRSRCRLVQQACCARVVHFASCMI